MDDKSQELEVVLQYVEEKEKLEEKHLLPDTLVGEDHVCEADVS